MFFRTTLILILGALTGIAGWWTLFIKDKVDGNSQILREKDAEIQTLHQEVQDKTARIDELDVELRELEVSMHLLKVDHRVARLEVIDQVPDPDSPDEVRTTVRFIELGPDGEPLGEGTEATISGDTVYLETQVIKFNDDYVEGGDFLRGTSICLFRRLFGENQPPVSGTAIDAEGMHPHPYRGSSDSEAGEFYTDLWSQFWETANDPNAASAKGVKSAHGEAPYIKVRNGKQYEVELRSSGGLSITPLN